MSFFSWSKTALTNATADSSINWQEGQSPGSVNGSARAMMAAAAKYRDDIAGMVATAGTAPTYTLTTNQVHTSLADGISVAFRCHATNTGDAGATINVDSLGAKALRQYTGAHIVAGKMLIGSIYRATYRLSTDEWILHNAYPETIPDLSGLYAPLNYTAPGTGGASRALTARIPEQAFSVFDYGAIAGGGTTDSATNATAFTNALAASAGGTLIIPEGVFYIRSLLVIKSNTRVFMEPGAVVKADVANWTGDKRIFRNENHSASSLTDTNIHLEGFGLIDMDGMAADTHAWYMRYVDTSSVRGCIAKGGGNFTAFLACVDTLTDGAEAQDVGNCGFDHWDGAGDAVVSNCTVRGSDAQGIQATGTATDLADRDTWNVKFIGNTIRGVRNGGGDASAIIFNTVDAGSTNQGGLSMGNYVEDCDIGLVFSGLGVGRQSINDTFRDVDQLPIFIQDDGGLPTDSRIINPNLIDCDHDAGNIALIQMGGDRNLIRGLKITNTGAAPYALIVWFRSDAAQCKVEYDIATSGSTGRFQNDGTGSDFLPKYPLRASTVTLEARGAAHDIVGAIAYATDGRKSGEGGGAGTGLPVWWDGTNWKNFHDNATLAD